MRAWIPASGALLFVVAAAAPDVRFVDATAAAGIAFAHRNAATSNKYLIETMGGGVALLDYDNDGRLDVFLTNGARLADPMPAGKRPEDRKSTRLNSSHLGISYAVFCLKKKKKIS